MNRIRYKLSLYFLLFTNFVFVLGSIANFTNIGSVKEVYLSFESWFYTVLIFFINLICAIYIWYNKYYFEKEAR